MSVYVTPCEGDKCTGESVLMEDFEDIDQVVEILGEPEARYRAFARYPGCIYTTQPFRIDRPVNQRVSYQSTATQEISEDVEVN